MLPIETYRRIASLLPGSPQSEVAHILHEAGARSIGPDEPFKIFWSQGRVDSINFTVGYPADAPIHHVRMSDHFQDMHRRYDPGVLGPKPNQRVEAVRLS